MGHFWKANPAARALTLTGLSQLVEGELREIPECLPQRRMVIGQDFKGNYIFQATQLSLITSPSLDKKFRSVLKIALQNWNQFLMSSQPSQSLGHLQYILLTPAKGQVQGPDSLEITISAPPNHDSCIKHLRTVFHLVVYHHLPHCNHKFVNPCKSLF